MKNILLASKNKGKIKELQQMLSGFDIEVLSLLDREMEDIEETGKTFAANATLKAEAASSYFNIPAVSDDSGLVIDALDGKPGVYSARYAGEDKDDNKNMDKVLEEMTGVPEDKRTARFVSVIALAVPGKDTLLFEGTCEGLITFEKHGDKGFGYDPIFYIPRLGKTMAELSSEQKNEISHRRKALEQLVDHWKKNDAVRGD